MSKRNITTTAAGFISRWGKALGSLYGRIRSLDRYSLICMITCAVFVLFGVFQLVLVILTPKTATFDHISLIIVDFIIAAFCIVYLIYRSGRLKGILPGGADKNSVAGQPEPADLTAQPKVSRRKEEFPVGTAHVFSAGGSRNNRSAVPSARLADESLISPGHRYSPGASQGAARGGDTSGNRHAVPSREAGSLPKRGFNAR